MSVRLSEIAEDYFLFTEAQERLKSNKGKTNVSFEEVMQNYGLTEEDIENAEDLEIE